MKKKVTRTIVGIDGSNLAFRYFAIPNPSFPPMVSLLNDIAFLCDKLRATDLFIAWEGLRSRHPRQRIYPDYKANRDSKMNDYKVKDIKRQMEKFDFHIGNAIPARQLRIDYLEADDSLALLAKHYYNKGEEYVVVLSTTDQDYYQLINDRVFMWNSKKKTLLTKSDIRRDYGMENPQNFAWIKAVAGDPADNIHGIKGIGIKTFLKMVADILPSDKLWTPDQIKDRLKSCKKPFKFEDIEKYYQIVQLQECLHPRGKMYFDSIIELDNSRPYDDLHFAKTMEMLHENFNGYSSRYIGNISTVMAELSQRKTVMKSLEGMNI